MHVWHVAACSLCIGEAVACRVPFVFSMEGIAGTDRRGHLSSGRPLNRFFALHCFLHAVSEAEIEPVYVCVIQRQPQLPLGKTRHWIPEIGAALQLAFCSALLSGGGCPLP